MVKFNLIANFAGNAWLAVVSLVFTPFYIHLMGVESYGLVGIYVSLQAMFLVIDLGLSQTLNRELARLSVETKNTTKMADTVRTLEVVYWGISLAVTLLLLLLSDVIAYRWLNPGELSRQSLKDVLTLLALVVGLRLPAALYTGGLNGLQRQVLANKLMAFFATFHGLGAIAVLWLVDSTPFAFFCWYALATLCQVVALRRALLKSLPLRYKGSFSIRVLKGVSGFASGMFATSALGVVFTQLDKVLLSKFLSLADFGYYTLAITAASVVSAVRVPILNAYFPRFSELVSRADEATLARNYHQGCQLMAICILPLVIVFVFFSNELLQLWIHDSIVVSHIAFIATLLFIGNAINSLLTLPYMMQLAYGWTQLGLSAHVVGVFIFVPMIYYMTSQYGAVGGALSWVAFNVTNFLLVIPIMHGRLLRDEKWRWYLQDVGKLLLISIAAISGGWLLVPADWMLLQKTFAIVIIYGISISCAALSAETLRKTIINNLMSLVK